MATLRKFFLDLDSLDKRITLDKLTGLMEKLDISLHDVQKYVHFSNERYQRNMVREGENYQALVLCWRNGQRSPIHDHRGSSCGVRVLKGTATETIFGRTSNGDLKFLRASDLHEREVIGSQDDDIHEVANLQDEGDLITLHVYSPALTQMGIYNLNNRMRTMFVEPINYFREGEGI